MEAHDERDVRPIMAVIVGMIVVGGGIDLVLDDPDRWLSFHVVYELLLLAGGLVMAVWVWASWREAERSLVEATRSLEERRAERDAWRESARTALEGLGHAVDAQFGAWGLTAAEREIALLLLKGHSHKRIAHLTGRSERTVRQHAVAVYHKAGVAGRAELGAFFLEDLLLPDAEREVVHPSAASALISPPALPTPPMPAGG